MQAIVETAVDGIISIDEHGTIQSINPLVVRVFRYAPEEVLGRNIRVLMPEPYQSQHDGYLTNYLTTGQRKVIGIGRVVEGLRKDGSVFPLDLAMSEFHIGEKRLFTGIVRDITERVEIERALQESENRFRAFFELSAVGQAEVDVVSTKYLAVNEKMSEVTGYSREELRPTCASSFRISSGTH